MDLTKLPLSGFFNVLSCVFTAIRLTDSAVMIQQLRGKAY